MVMEIKDFGVFTSLLWECEQKKSIGTDFHAPLHKPQIKHKKFRGIYLPVYRLGPYLELFFPGLKFVTLYIDLWYFDYRSSF